MAAGISQWFVNYANDHFVSFTSTEEMDPKRTVCLFSLFPAPVIYISNSGVLLIMYLLNETYDSVQSRESVPKAKMFWLPYLLFCSSHTLGLTSTINLIRSNVDASMKKAVTLIRCIFIPYKQSSENAHIQLTE